MPEYLAPAVYIEEVDTGSKPIEGVSTSTAGMIGVTERGPIGIPVLVTSVGEYQRWFGQTLNIADFGDHAYLPHAIDGFFTNGGKRCYVVRVLDPAAASFAETDLFVEESATTTPILLAPAMAGATSLLLSDSLTIAAGDWIRVGAGSDSEYREPPTGTTANASDFVPLQLPTQLSHGTAVSAEHYALGAAVGTLSLAGDSVTGATQLVLTGAGPVTAGQLPRPRC